MPKADRLGLASTPCSVQSCFNKLEVAAATPIVHHKTPLPSTLGTMGRLKFSVTQVMIGHLVCTTPSSPNHLFFVLPVALLYLPLLRS